jgi:hypothetical protein
MMANCFGAEFTVIEAENECRLVTPFHRPDGEAVEVVLQKTAHEQVRLTDEFLTADYLFLNGLNLADNQKLYDEANRMARLRGVQFQEAELFIEAAHGQEAEDLRKLLNAIEAVTCLIYHFRLEDEMSNESIKTTLLKEQGS